MMGDKQRSIIIYKVEESKKENAEERKKEVDDIVARLCNEGACVQGCKVTKTFRLGKYDKEKNIPRTLKVSPSKQKGTAAKTAGKLEKSKRGRRGLKKIKYKPRPNKGSQG